MITINKILLPLTLIAGSEIVLVTEVRPVREFLDGKSTDRIIGYRYTCVCPDNKFEQMLVKVEEAAPAITQEMLDACGGTVKAKPKGFVGRFYRDRAGEYQFTAKATAIEVLK